MINLECDEEREKILSAKGPMKYIGNNEHQAKETTQH